MPKLWERKGAPEDGRSPWFVKISNQSPPPPTYTFQLKPTGIRILRSIGLASGDTFDHEQFWILHDLGLTYTLNEDPTPELEQAVSETVISGLQPEQRVLFVIELLADHPVAEIQSDGFYRLLNSIEHGPDDIRIELLEFILKDTPIESSHPDGLANENHPLFTSSIFGALVCRAFSEVLDEERHLDTTYCEPIARNNDYVYLITSGTAWEQTSSLDAFHLDVPEFYLDEVLPVVSAGWEQAVLEEIHKSQFLGDALLVSHTIGTRLYDGLDIDDGIIIVPKQLLVETSFDHTFNFDV